MYRILQKDYTFISTGDINVWKKEQGWEFDAIFTYELKANYDREAYHTALRLAKESDVMIFGSAPEEFVKERMLGRQEGITLRYSERVFKRGRWRFLSPRGWMIRRNTYYRYRKHQLYMLCASAYTAGDLLLQGSYLGKCYKWGYFPEMLTYNLEELLLNKAKRQIEILWCGRLIDWKHPEVAIKLAILLKQAGYDFILNLIGSGEKEDMVHTMIVEYKLENYVKLLGAFPPEQVRKQMEKSNLFLSTSDFQEGWGAVINEAMNSACTVVASHAVGAVPYLIQDGSNGYVYKNGDIHSLYRKVTILIEDRKLCEEMGRKAYHTIVNEWNAQIAVKRLFLLIEDLNTKGSSDRYLSGPCSKAKFISNHWFKEDRSRS